MPKLLQLTKWHGEQQQELCKTKLGKLSNDKMYKLTEKQILKMSNIRRKEVDK